MPAAKALDSCRRARKNLSFRDVEELFQYQKHEFDERYAWCINVTTLGPATGCTSDRFGQLPSKAFVEEWNHRGGTNTSIA